MGREILCTVGTSLLTNRKTPWGGRPPGSDSPLPDGALVRQWLSEAGPTLACAETNTLNRLSVRSEDRLVFLHSDTPEGRFCGQSLVQYYSDQEVSAEQVQVGELGYGAMVFSSGLKSLVHIVVGRVIQSEKEGWMPVFAATGGFKAEVAFLNLLGALLGIEVYYIHELHRELVCLPPLPLDWNSRAILDQAPFFEWLEAAPRRKQEVDQRVASRADLARLVETDAEGRAYLSPAGLLLFEAAKAKETLASL